MRRPCRTPDRKTQPEAHCANCPHSGWHVGLGHDGVQFGPPLAMKVRAQICWPPQHGEADQRCRQPPGRPAYHAGLASPAAGLMRCG
jgi:hypothetical protein